MSTEQVGSTLNWAGLGPAPGPLQNYVPQWMGDPASWWKNKLGIGGGGAQQSTQASDTFAAMTRDMWTQWTQQFLPIENTLIDYASDAKLPNTNAAKAVQGVQGAYQQAGITSDLARKTSGIMLNDDEKQALARSRNLSQSLAEVQAGNTARTLTVDRQRSILGAPVNTGDLSIRGGR